MPLIFNPMLSFNLEEKDDIRIFVKDEEGNDIDITEYVATINSKLADKVNTFQGATNGNKVMITDPQGNITTVEGVVMNISEREKLASLTNPVLLKGIINSYEALYQVENPQVGWCYYVRFANGENDNLYEEYVYTADHGWELFGHFNASAIPQYVGGTATEIDNTFHVNLKYDPDVFEVDEHNRLNIKDFSYVRKCTQESEINTVEIGSIFHWQGIDNQSIIVVDTNGTQTHIKYGYFYKKESDKIVLINKEPVKDSVAVDVNVSTWSEFVVAVRNSARITTRIHLISNITVTSVETLDMSNCMVYGHYHKWIVNNITTILSGTYAYFNDVWIQGANNGAASTKIFTLQGQSSSSCTYIFDNCRIYNFLEVDNAAFIGVNSASSSSIHIILHLCSVNGESDGISNRVLQIQNGGNGYGVTLKVINLIHNNTTYESNKVGIIGSQNIIDSFYGDGSVEYVSDYHPQRFCQWGNTTYTLRNINEKIVLTPSNGTTSEVSLNTLINGLSTGDSDPQDNDYIISQYVNGGTTTTTYHRRPLSKFWNWIKSKLGIGTTNDGTFLRKDGTWATPTDTKATVTTTGSGNAITSLTASNGALTATKGSTFLTSHQDISGKVSKSGDSMSGTLTFTTANAINYNANNGNISMIRFKAGDANGHGIVIGGGGLTIIGAGESSTTVAAQASSGGSETMQVCSDESIEFYTNCQSGFSSAKKSYFDSNGDLHINRYAFATHYNQSSSDQSSMATSSSYIMFCNLDGYLRKATVAQIKSLVDTNTWRPIGTGATDAAAGNHSHSAATQSAAGFMSAADKKKLDGIASGATANSGTVTSVKVGSTSYSPSSGVVSLPAYPTSLPASDVYAWAKASTKPSYTASEVGALSNSISTFSGTGYTAIQIGANNGGIVIIDFAYRPTSTTVNLAVNGTYKKQFCFLAGNRSTNTSDTTAVFKLTTTGYIQNESTISTNTTYYGQVIAVRAS